MTSKTFYHPQNDPTATRAQQQKGTVEIRNTQGANDQRLLDALTQSNTRALGAIDAYGTRLDAMEKRLSTPNGPDNPFASFGEFLSTVRRAANNGPVDKRLESRAAGLNGSGAPDEGGFLLPSQYSRALMDSITYAAPIASRTMRIPAVSQTLVIPAVDETSRANGSRWGGVVSNWADEGTLMSSGKPKFRRLELGLNKLAAMVYGTEEISDDGALGAFVGMAFTAEAAFQLDDMIVNGSGLGQPLGILNAPGLITVAKDSGQASGTISAANVANAFARMLPESRQQAVWLVSPELEESLYLAPLVISGSSPNASPNLFTPADEGAPFGRLMSRPILPVEQASTIGTPGDIIFADLSKYVVFEKPVDVKLSIHVRFIQGEGVYRMSYRVDGAPIIKSPITPKAGGPTKSAFVAIAAR